MLKWRCRDYYKIEIGDYHIVRYYSYIIQYLYSVKVCSVTLK